MRITMHNKQSGRIAYGKKLAPHHYQVTLTYVQGKKGGKRYIPTQEVNNYRDYIQAIRMWFSGEHVDDVLMVVKG